MGTHTSPTSQRVEDRSMGIHTGPTSHRVEDSSMGAHIGPTLVEACVCVQVVCVGMRCLCVCVHVGLLRSTSPVLHDKEAMFGGQSVEILSCLGCEVLHDVCMCLQHTDVRPHSVGKLHM